MNDPFELAPYDISDREFRTTHKKLVKEFAKKLGLICLSETKSSPAMWAHFTNNHEGACLELDVTYDSLFKVTYDNDKLFKGIDLTTYSTHVNRDNIKTIYGTKSKDWSYEKEHRLLVPLNNPVVTSDGDNHFLPFHRKQDGSFVLKRIYVGYRCWLGINELSIDVKDYRHKAEVVQTRPAFGKFKVVRQKDTCIWSLQASNPKKIDKLPAVKALF